MSDNQSLFQKVEKILKTEFNVNKDIYYTMPVSDLELDSSNDNTAFDSIDLDSELYYSNPFVTDSELICSIG